ncbi:MAG: hypothetical protein FRX49_13140 [Trebouxia sp. A1-2]|nr:MAG: hypothetical protein FRX49_13140 [Trebouxia sp. A1-2]
MQGQSENQDKQWKGTGEGEARECASKGQGDGDQPQDPAGDSKNMFLRCADVLGDGDESPDNSESRRRMCGMRGEVWDSAHVKGLESVEEAPDEPGFANTLLQPHLWQVWDRAQVEGLEVVEEAPDESGSVWDRAQVEGLEDVEETPDDLGVVAGHGRVPQVAHQRIDCNCGVVILTARHQSCCGQQVPSILSVPPYSTCNHQNIGAREPDSPSGVRLPLGPHPFPFKLALSLDVGLIHFVGVRLASLTDLEDFNSGLRGALAEHLEQHTQQLGVLHVGGHHHPCALNYLQATSGLT